MAARRLIASEHQEQVALLDWTRTVERQFPEVAWLFAIPNGAYKSRSAAGRFRAEGLKSGVPDLCLPYPRGRYSALYVEMKRRKGGRIEPEQRAWIDALTLAGNCVVVCFGWEDAAQGIVKYLRGEM